jgi:hypothetical protein
VKALLSERGVQVTSDYRKEFMLRTYSAFWDCVSRAEDSAWKIVAAYVALFAGLSFFIR